MPSSLLIDLPISRNEYSLESAPSELILLTKSLYSFDTVIEKYTSSLLLSNIVTGIGVSVISILVPLSFSFIMSLLVVTMSSKFAL